MSEPGQSKRKEGSYTKTPGMALTNVGRDDEKASHYQCYCVTDSENS